MNPPDPLDAVFASWRDQAPPAVPSVAGEVRRRLHTIEARQSLGGRLLRIEAAFARPSFATAFVAACVLLGLFLAEVRITQRENERSARVEQSYLRLIDPLIVESTPSDSGISP